MKDVYNQMLTNNRRFRRNEGCWEEAFQEDDSFYTKEKECLKIGYRIITRGGRNVYEKKNASVWA